MGQKVNPIIYRVGQSIDSKQNWVGVETIPTQFLTTADILCQRYLTTYNSFFAGTKLEMTSSKATLNISIIVPPQGNASSEDKVIMSDDANNALNKLANLLQATWHKNSTQPLNISFEQVKEPSGADIKGFISVYGTRLANLFSKTFPNITDLLYVILLGLATNNATAISYILVQIFEKLPANNKQRLFLTALRTILNKYIQHPNGYRIQVRGRLRGHKRRQKSVIGAGKLSIPTINKVVDYKYTTVKTTAGILGIKVWVHQD